MRDKHACELPISIGGEIVSFLYLAWPHKNGASHRGMVCHLWLALQQNHAPHRDARREANQPHSRAPESVVRRGTGDTTSQHNPRPFPACTPARRPASSFKTKPSRRAQLTSVRCSISISTHALRRRHRSGLCARADSSGRACTSDGARVPRPGPQPRQVPAGAPGHGVQPILPFLAVAVVLRVQLQRQGEHGRGRNRRRFSAAAVAETDAVEGPRVQGCVGPAPLRTPGEES
jgi:hypothetical protein